MPAQPAAPAAHAPTERPSSRIRRDSITISHVAEARLSEMPSDPALAAAARSVLTKALGLRARQQLVLILESGHLEAFGAALLREAVDLGVETRTYLVDDVIVRSPAFVARLEANLDESDGSVLVGSIAGLCPEFRRRVCTLPGRRRHAHMVGLTEPMLRQSLRADWDEVHTTGERVRARLAEASRLEVRTGPSCTLQVTLDSSHRWHNGSGRLRDPGFSNLPGGEVVSSPGKVEGSFRAEGGVWLPSGELVRAPHRFTFAGGEVAAVEGPCADTIVAAMDAAPNGRRAGQIAFGTNLSVLTPIGAMLQDLKIPGFHMVLGYSCPEHTGASWTSEVMIPILSRRPDVTVDGEPILVRGKYARWVTGLA
ncbi:MAG: aminopeptidase [Myxococcales bacterium]|nr:aminopeptidase [Myxococcales bacterium]